jgi:hypothetical protein
MYGIYATVIRRRLFQEISILRNDLRTWRKEHCDYADTLIIYCGLESDRADNKWQNTPWDNDVIQETIYH